ncbi:MAG: hypothetical protein ACTHJV_13815, partial [Rhizobiaceae bacterium]
MALWKRQNLAFRLSASVAIVVLLSFAILEALSLSRDIRHEIATERERLQGIAAAFSAAAADGLSRSDRRAVLEALRGIRALKDARHIAVVQNDGRLFAELGSSVALAGRDGNAADDGVWSALNADLMATNAPIRSGGRQIGVLKLDTDISWLRRQVLGNLLRTLLVGFAAAFSTVVIANLVIRRLTNPLRNMAGEIVRMGESLALEHRFASKDDDEIG